MGLRFRKSFKVAPGVKLNLNKKSTSVTFGGKGAHYTVSSTCKKTKSVGIPGTGLYYTETSSGNKDSDPPPLPPEGNPGLNTSPDNPNNKKKRGCLFYFLALLAICFAIALYSFAWIPAIGFLIYFIIKKDLYGTKRRNIAISTAVFVTSLIVFALLGSSSTSPESIYADWGKDTFDVSETAEVKITTSPSDAEITSLELSSNDIAELNYTDGKAIITFKEPGEAALFFTANHDIDSNTVKISVTDKVAEEAKAKAEEEARLKAEQEAQAKAEEEARIKAEQEAQAKAEEEARIKAEQEAQAAEEARIKAEQEAQAAEQARIAQEQAAAQAAAQQPQEASVWLSATGSKYHSVPDCGNMNPNTARQVSLSEAQSLGYEPCKNCH